MDKEPEVVEAEVIECKGASDFKKGLAVFFVIMSMLYAVSPIDLAPDTIPVVGWLDDVGFLAAATMNIVQQFAKDQNSSMVKISRPVQPAISHLRDTIPTASSASQALQRCS